MNGLKFGLLVGCCLAACFVASGQPLCADEPVEQAKVEARALSQAFRDAARDATPSVVTILSYGQNLPDEADRSEDHADDEDPSQDDDNGNELTPEDLPLDRSPSPVQSQDGKQLTITGLGSGVIINADGQVITNHHVVAGAKKVMVQLQDQTELEAFDIHGDPASDIATFRLKAADPIPSARLGDANLLEIGDWVLAIGSPFKLEATVSAGIISAKNREIKGISRGRLLQTDAAINPGNSGGPLINLDGEVVAISTAIATRNGGYQGIGFAIPINQAKWIADELVSHGRVRRASIGIKAAELNKRIAAKLNLPQGAGVAVYELIEGGTADKAGLKQLDIITELAGEKIRDGVRFQQLIERLPIGSTQPVLILRDGKEMELKIVIAPIEDPTEIKQEAEPQAEPSQDDASAEQANKQDAPESSVE